MELPKFKHYSVNQSQAPLSFFFQLRKQWQSQKANVGFVYVIPNILKKQFEVLWGKERTRFIAYAEGSCRLAYTHHDRYLCVFNI